MPCIFMCLINAKNDVERMKADIRQRAVRRLPQWNGRTLAVSDDSERRRKLGHVCRYNGRDKSFFKARRRQLWKQAILYLVAALNSEKTKPHNSHSSLRHWLSARKCRRANIGALLTTALKVAHDVAAPRAESAVYSCLFTTK